jgi:hypothetical protein
VIAGYCGCRASHPSKTGEAHDELRFGPGARGSRRAFYMCGVDK